MLEPLGSKYLGKRLLLDSKCSFNSGCRVSITVIQFRNVNKQGLDFNFIKNLRVILDILSAYIVIFYQDTPALRGEGI